MTLHRKMISLAASASLLSSHVAMAQFEDFPPPPPPVVEDSSGMGAPPPVVPSNPSFGGAGSSNSFGHGSVPTTPSGPSRVISPTKGSKSSVLNESQKSKFAKGYFF